MSNGLQLFRVTVTHTWSAEADALVMALQAPVEEAKPARRRRVKR